MEAVKYSIYKGMGGKYGAAQFQPLPPLFRCNSCGEKNYETWEHTKNKECDGRMDARPGAILVEAASAVGKNQYDWRQKISIALDITDLGKILHGFAKGSEIEIFHDPNMKGAAQGKTTKKMVMSPGKEGGYILNMSQSDGGEKRSHSIPLLPEEVRTLRILLTSAVPQSLAWS